MTLFTFLFALSASASEPAWDTLANNTDWKDVGTRKSKVGEIQISSKRIDGVGCLHGSTVVDTSPERLVAVTRDMVRAIDWSTADLALSEQLTGDANSFVLMQYYAAPGWTFAADRFWVIEGEHSIQGNSGKYRWERVSVDGYPDALASAHALSKNAIELPTNYGEWTFSRTDAGTEVQYRSCADFGGRLPTGVQVWLNTQQLPNLIADLVIEANRR